MMDLSNSFSHYFNDFSSLLNNIDVTSLIISEDNDLGLVFDYDNKTFIAHIRLEEFKDEEV